VEKRCTFILFKGHDVTATTNVVHVGDILFSFPPMWLTYLRNETVQRERTEAKAAAVALATAAAATMTAESEAALDMYVFAFESL